MTRIVVKSKPSPSRNSLCLWCHVNYSEVILCGGEKGHSSKRGIESGEMIYTINEIFD